MAFNRAQFDAILAGMRQGRSVISASQAVGLEPTAIYRWIDGSPELAQEYARAIDDRTELHAEQVVDISDEPISTDDDGRMDAAAVQRQRLRVDARKWVAAKMKPKKYGDRQTLEHEGSINLGFADALKAARERVIDDQL